MVEIKASLSNFTKRATFRILLFIACIAIGWMLFGETTGVLVGSIINAISIEILFKRLRDLK